MSGIFFVTEIMFAFRLSVLEKPRSMVSQTLPRRQVMVDDAMRMIHVM